MQLHKLLSGDFMLNWRKIKNAALAATVMSSTLGAMTTPASADQDVTKDFKFPIVLCRFKQAVLKDSSGRLQVSVDQDWGPEYAFPVENVRALNTRSKNGQMIRVMDGGFTGEYDVPNSSYRLKIEGSIRQGSDANVDHQMRFRTYLQKKLDKPDAAGNLWREVGQSHDFVTAKTQPDGKVWENIYPYTTNSLETSRYLVQGKLKRDLVTAGIRDGVLEKGTVFKVGPACGFLDGRTAKSVASAENREKFRTLFAKISDAPETPVMVAQAHPLLLKKPAEALATPANNEVASNDPTQNHDLPAAQNMPLLHPLDQAQGQVSANANPDANQQSGQEMSQQLQADLATQNRLADQAAAAYNIQQQQAQGGALLPNADGRDPASSFQLAQAAQSLQASQTPEQIQQNLSQLEQQRQALMQQQSVLDQQQQMLMQRQQDVALAQNAQVDANAATQASSSPAQPTSGASLTGQGF
jgi:hypothetical protein